MTKSAGFAAVSATAPLTPHTYELRPLKDDDVHIDVQYCGICHSDIHTARSEWAGTQYPCQPGHEIAGVVKAVGSKVTKYKVGDHVGVGCMVDSCLNCEQCKDHRECSCSKLTFTYNSADMRSPETGKHTFGGFGRDIVVREEFVLNMKSLPLDKACVLLCAGITTYSPIKFYNMNKPGKRVGVVGLGGLGHVAVMILKGFGAHPVVISTSERKREDALKLGAVDFINSKDPEQMKKHAETLYGIIDTVSAAKDINPYIDLLHSDSVLCQVGLPPSDQPLPQVNPLKLIFRRKGYVGSLIGGIKETQEMLDFCGEHKISPWTELIPMDKVNEAFDRAVKGDVKFRFVLDVAKTGPTPQ